MGHRINERNIGFVTNAVTPKRKSNKLNAEELDIAYAVLDLVYSAMDIDDITGTYTDGGRIIISLTGEQMFDLFEAKRKLKKIQHGQ